MKMNEIFSMSIQALRTNKLRALLTVLGVVVGIFSIVVIMTIITMLQKSIENGVSQLNKNTFQIQKYPVIFTQYRYPLGEKFLIKKNIIIRYENVVIIRKPPFF